MRNLERGTAIATSECGVALLACLMMVTLLAALALSLALSCMTEVNISGSFAAGVEMLYAADAAVEGVMADLVAMPDWNRVLDGTAISEAADGPRGPRWLPDGSLLDLRTVRVASEGPWGADNAQWQLYASAPLAALLPPARGGAPHAYVAVWAGDDPRETDGNPLVDSNGAILLVAHAYGRGGVRRAIEVAVSRAFAPESEGGGAIGVRVLSWREIH